MASSPTRSGLQLKERSDEDSADEQNCTSPRQCVSVSADRTIEYARGLNSNLQMLIRMLEQHSDMREPFLLRFTEWKPNRVKNMENLTKIADALDKIHKDCNIAQAAASTGTIISGMIGLAGAVASGFEGNCAEHLCLAAGGGSLLSAGVSCGTAFAEAGLSEIQVKKAQSLLKEDRKQLSEIVKFLNCTETMISVMDEICGISVIKDVIQKLVVIVPEATQAYGSVTQQANSVINQVLQVIEKNKSADDREKIVLLSTSVCSNAKLFASVKDVGKVIGSSSMVTPVTITLMKVQDDIKFMQASIKRYRTGEKVSREQAISYGIFQAVNIGLGLISLLTTVDDIQDGSISEYATKVREARKMLELELQLISNVYNNFK